MERLKEKKFSLNEKEKKLCIELARKSIKYFFENNSVLHLSEKEIREFPKKFLEQKACFVTLTIDKELKGCIGHLEAIQPLYEDIMENAVSAAFSDPRFDSLQENEFQKTKIEISILTEPKELEYKGSSDLLKKIVKGKDGLIIKKGYHSATFLPSVWEQIPKKEEFLSQLCVKAGLLPEEWKLLGLKVQKYYSIKAKEK